MEIECGTGLNFDLLQEQIGPGGHIVGVDLTPQMLEQADGSGNGDGNGFKLGGDGIAVAHRLVNSIAFLNGTGRRTSRGESSRASPTETRESVRSLPRPVR